MLFAELKKDFETHRKYCGYSSYWRVLRLPSIKILISYRIRTKARQLGIPLVSPLLALLERILWGIELATDIQLGSVIILHPVGVVIGFGAALGDGTSLCGSNTIGGRYRTQSEKEEISPQIGKNVQIGCGARILGSVTVGDRVSIGANAVVITDIPADSIAMGIPAKWRKVVHETN